MTKEPISIELQWANYCSRVGLVRGNVTENQWLETKQAFYAGVSSLLVLMKTSIPDLPEAQGILALEKLNQEADFFWRRFIVN